MTEEEIKKAKDAVILAAMVYATGAKDFNHFTSTIDLLVEKAKQFGREHVADALIEEFKKDV